MPGRLPVEVERDAVSHVRLDQRLQPVGRPRLRVPGVQRGHERRHRRVGIGAELAQPVAQEAEVGVLGHGQLTQRGPVGQRGRQGGGVLGHPLVGAELRIGQHAEQIDDSRRLLHGRQRTSVNLREHTQARPALWYRVHCSVKVRPHCVNSGESPDNNPRFPGCAVAMTREGWLYREDPRHGGCFPPVGPGRPAFI